MLQGSSTWTSGVSSGIAGDIGSSLTSSAIGLAGTFLDDIQVDFLITATQAQQSTRTLTAPRITLFNGQRAYITVATQQAYVANYEPVVAENAAALRPIIGYVPTGTVLDVEATVSADWKYVTMTVRPQVAELLPPLDEITFGIASGRDLTIATIQLPTVTVQDLQTTVSVPDGGTLLLGGQKAAGEVEQDPVPQPALQQPLQGAGRVHAADPDQTQDHYPARGGGRRRGEKLRLPLTRRPLENM
jgi:type II secretory pathway component GspD/PulD (secretin)